MKNKDRPFLVIIIIFASITPHDARVEFYLVLEKYLQGYDTMDKRKSQKMRQLNFRGPSELATGRTASSPFSPRAHSLPSPLVARPTERINQAGIYERLPMPRDKNSEP